MEASAAQPKVVERVCIWRFWKWVEQNNFEPFEVCQSAVEESLTTGNYSNQGVNSE